MINHIHQEYYLWLHQYVSSLVNHFSTHYSQVIAELLLESPENTKQKSNNHKYYWQLLHNKIERFKQRDEYLSKEDIDTNWRNLFDKELKHE